MPERAKRSQQIVRVRLISQYLDVCALLGLDPAVLMCAPADELRSPGLFDLEMVPVAPSIESILEAHAEMSRDDTELSADRILERRLIAKLQNIVRRLPSRQGRTDSLLFRAISVYRLHVRTSEMQRPKRGAAGLSGLLIETLGIADSEAEILVALLKSLVNTTGCDV